MCKSSGWIHIVLSRSEEHVQLINNASLFFLSVLFGRHPNKMHLVRMRARDPRIRLNRDEISVSRVVHVSWQLAASDSVVKELMSLNDINFKAALISSFCPVLSLSLSFFKGFKLCRSFN